MLNLHILEILKLQKFYFSNFSNLEFPRVLKFEIEKLFLTLIKIKRISQ